MATNRFPVSSAICLLFLLSVFFCFPGCSSEGKSEPSAPTENPEVVGYTTAHFTAFEVAVPEHWTQRGNVGKLYEGDGMFLLAGPLEAPGNNPLSSLEATLSEELELFFNSEYYRSKTRFQYDRQEEGNTLIRVVGTLWNDRSGTSLRFAGAYGTSPGSYFIYFWPDAAGDREGVKRMEVSYEHFKVL